MVWQLRLLPRALVKRQNTCKMIHALPVPGKKKSTVNLQNKKFIFPFAAAVSREEDNLESCCHVEVTMGRKDCLMSRQLIFLGDTQQPQWAQRCFYHHKSVFSFHLHRAEVMWDLAFEMFQYRSGVVFPQT